MSFDSPTVNQRRRQLLRSAAAVPLAAGVPALALSATTGKPFSLADYRGKVVAHSSYLYFIDRRGMLRALLPFGRPAADIVHDARALLEEP
ncbi:hypothetical protein NX774_18535 [Massilia agilis]|uniref:Uncharacterized protein n=1 Tax=Massilia agilis TaxID=1811226 RepID=A0ABT2DFD1_9BURK|nr:hypothetical protein [Massilia agilis]MCS0809924.1 hypothetical protein [Massilia agilis]